MSDHDDPQVDRFRAQLDAINLCRTCANAGWIGSRSNPTDCPTCGRKPYWLVGDGTYPAPTPKGETP
jgi:rubrerythrin